MPELEIWTKYVKQLFSFSEQQPVECCERNKTNEINPAISLAF